MARSLYNQILLLRWWLFTLGHSALGAIFTVTAQFVLAIGSGIVLMYVIARGMRLADQ